MPTYFIAMVGFFLGWGLCAWLLIAARPFFLAYAIPGTTDDRAAITKQRRESRSLLSDQSSPESEDRLSNVRLSFGVILLCACIILVVLIVLETSGSQWAFGIEETLVDPRLSVVIVAFVIGFACRAYQQQVVGALRVVTDVALDGPRGDKQKALAGADHAEKPKLKTRKVNPAHEKEERPKPEPWEKSLPLFLQIGTVMAIIVVAVLAFNPQILRGLTSLKAGEFEAHFVGPSGGAKTVQSVQLVLLGPQRKKVADNWANFTFPSAKKVAKPDYRIVTYQANETPFQWRMDLAEAFFDEQLLPIFQRWRCADVAKEPIALEDQNLLRKITSQWAHEVNRGRSPSSYQAPEERAKRMGDTESLVKSLVDKIDANKSISGVCKNLFVENLKFPSRDKYFELLAQHKDADIWDPYVIQAIGDLLLIAWDRRSQEDFLVTASTDLSKGASVCDGGCLTTPVAGQLSLAYALVTAKIQSERPWPFEDMRSQLAVTLRDINRVLSLNKSWPTDGRKPLETDAVYRRNRLIDLSVGLELFYQRALVGHRFNAVQIQTWREWLAETRGVLNLIADIGDRWPPPFDADTGHSWMLAKQKIDADSYILQEAAIGSALSLVLIPGAAGEEPSSADCLKAKSLLNYASNEHLAIYLSSSDFSEDDRGTYIGFLEQIRTQINNRCNG